MATIPSISAVNWLSEIVESQVMGITRGLPTSCIGCPRISIFISADKNIVTDSYDLKITARCGLMNANIGDTLCPDGSEPNRLQAKDMGMRRKIADQQMQQVTSISAYKVQELELRCLEFLDLMRSSDLVRVAKNTFHDIALSRYAEADYWFGTLESVNPDEMEMPVMWEGESFDHWANAREGYSDHWAAIILAGPFATHIEPTGFMAKHLPKKFVRPFRVVPAEDRVRNPNVRMIMPTIADIKKQEPVQADVWPSNRDIYDGWGSFG